MTPIMMALSAMTLIRSSRSTSLAPSREVMQDQISRIETVLVLEMVKGEEVMQESYNIRIRAMNPDVDPVVLPVVLPVEALGATTKLGTPERALTTPRSTSTASASSSWTREEVEDEQLEFCDPTGASAGAGERPLPLAPDPAPTAAPSLAHAPAPPTLPSHGSHDDGEDEPLAAPSAFPPEPPSPHRTAADSAAAPVAPDAYQQSAPAAASSGGRDADGRYSHDMVHDLDSDDPRIEHCHDQAAIGGWGGGGVGGGDKGATLYDDSREVIRSNNRSPHSKVVSFNDEVDQALQAHSRQPEAQDTVEDVEDFDQEDYNRYTQQQQQQQQQANAAGIRGYTQDQGDGAVQDFVEDFEEEADGVMDFYDPISDLSQSSRDIR